MYYQALQSCKVVLNFKGAGWDTFRYWENMACHSVQLAELMPLQIPNSFREGMHLFCFTDFSDLCRGIDSVLEEKINSKRLIEAAHGHLREFHLTTGRAMYFLDSLRAGQSH
jgi:spore maturation protein CgeB